MREGTTSCSSTYTAELFQALTGIRAHACECAPVMCTVHVTRKLTFPDLDIHNNQELARERSDHQGQEMESNSLQWDPAPREEAEYLAIHGTSWHSGPKMGT